MALKFCYKHRLQKNKQASRGTYHSKSSGIQSPTSRRSMFSSHGFVFVATWINDMCFCSVKSPLCMSVRWLCCCFLCLLVGCSLHWVDLPRSEESNATQELIQVIIADKKSRLAMMPASNILSFHTAAVFPNLWWMKGSRALCFICTTWEWTLRKLHIAT